MKMIKGMMRALMIVGALMVIGFAAIFRVPAVNVDVAVNRHVRRAITAARRSDAEGKIDLVKRRKWYTYTTTGSLNGLFPTIYDAARFVLRDYGIMPPLVRNLNAQTMAPRVFSRSTQGTASEMTEGSAYSAAALTKTVLGTVTPKEVQHGYLLTDAAMMTDPDDAARRAALESGMALAAKVDADMVGLFTSFTASKGTGGSALTLGAAASAMSVLRSRALNSVYSVVLHPFQWHDIAIQLTNVNTNPINVGLGDLANQALRDYYVSSVLGMRWITSASIGTTGTAGTAFAAAFDRDAIAYDVRRPLQMETIRKPENRGEFLSWTHFYGAGIQDDRNGVKLASRVVEPS